MSSYSKRFKKVNRLPLSVLYIESDPTHRNKTSAALAENVEELSIAEDRERGYQYFQEYSPDIVVTDLKIAREDDFRLLRQFFAKRSDLPIFALTSHDEMPYLTEAVELGVRYYLHKRKNPSKLLESLRDFFQFDFTELLHSTLDETGRFRDVSDAFANYVGRTPEEMKRQPLDFFAKLPDDFDLPHYIRLAMIEEKSLPVLTFERSGKTPRQLGSVTEKVEEKNLSVLWYPIADTSPSYYEFHEKLRREAHLKSLLGFLAKIGRLGIESTSKNLFLQKILQLIPEVSYDTEGLLLSQSDDGRLHFVNATKSMALAHLIDGTVANNEANGETDFLPLLLAAHHRQIVFMDDISALQASSFKKELEQMGVTTVVTIPVTDIDKIGNFIFVLLFRNRHPFDKEELELWQSIADTIGFSLASINYKEERDRLIAKLDTLAHTDQLTNLLNRYRGVEIIEGEITRAHRYGHPLSILFFDIDKFKEINDTYGHEVGDRVLRETAARIKSSLRSVDYFIRWGGEEFIVVLPDTELPGAVRLAHKLREAVSRKSGALPISISASFGVAQWNPGEDLDTFISRADRKMYEAKRQGRNRISY